MSEITKSAPELKTEIHIHNPKNKIKDSAAYKTFTVCNTILMIIISLVTLFPFLYLILQSFTSDHAIIAGELSIQAFLDGKLTFEDFSINTYIYVVTRNNHEFLRYYGNTIFYTVVGTILSLFFSAILAYPLSNPKLRVNKILSPFIIFTMDFGGGLMANYVLMRKLGLKNSLWGFILPMLISTYYVILMRSFFMSIPKDLEEAGEIDGLNKFGVFRHIALPLSTPIMATMTLFYAVMYWNNWFNAKLYLQDKSKWPVAYFLQTIIRGAGASDPDAQNMSANIKSCAMVLTVLPIICIYPFIQKYYVQGMMLGGVKE